MKKVLVLLLASAIALCSIAVLAEETANVAVDDVLVKFDQPPVVVDGRTLVPIRAVAEQIGAEVRWNENTQTATVIYKGIGVALQIGNIQMVVRNLTTSEERQVALDVAPQTYNGRTLLPIRAILEEFGCKVSWDASSSTVVITTSDYNALQTQKTIVIGE